MHVSLTATATLVRNNMPMIMTHNVRGGVVDGGSDTLILFYILLNKKM